MTKETEELRLTQTDRGLLIDLSSKKLLLSYDEVADRTFEEARFIVNGDGGDETIDNWKLISEYLDDINYMLCKSGCKPVKGEYWTKEQYTIFLGLSWSIKAESGKISAISSTRIRKARAIKDITYDK